MKFGVFLPNGSNGYIVSKAVEPYTPSFKHNLEITLAAEQQGFDFVLSMMKFKGFGGETRYWDACLESFTLMAGLAAATKSITLVPTIALLAQHPAYVARIVSTLDDISQQRCAVNIVTGWNQPEYSQMGLWKGDAYYNQRYEYATEYVDILQQLWSAGTVTHDSHNFNLIDCSCLPMPKRHIPIISAGQSPKGVDFVARKADQNFVMASPRRLKDISSAVKAKGASLGREVGTYALFTLIAESTDEKAVSVVQNIVDKADLGAIENILGSASLDANKGGTSDHLQHALDRDVEEGNIALMGHPAICGSFETVSDKINQIISDTGIDGMLFCWPEYRRGIQDFGEKIKPRLVSS